MSDTIPILADDDFVGGCGYQGHEFGASYPDSTCLAGYLWDADSGDGDPEGRGWVYTSGGEIPCPQCNADEHKRYISNDEDV